VPWVISQFDYIVQDTSLSKSSSSSNLWAGNREKVRAWVRERAQKFITEYSNVGNPGSQDPSTILTNLTLAITTLQSSVRTTWLIYFFFLDCTKPKIKM
jgi:hypothetical protein